MDSLDENQESEPPGHQGLEAGSRVGWALTSVRNQECFQEAETPPAVETGTKVILGDAAHRGEHPERSLSFIHDQERGGDAREASRGVGVLPNGEDGSKEVI